jgi:DNA-binding SARP family transcriptional activator
VNGRFDIALFGSFHLRCDGRPLTSHIARKVQELLAYLILERGRSHSREQLACRLWPESDGAHGRKNLRQALWQLKSGLLEVGIARHEEFLRVHSSSVELAASETAVIDVVLFDRACQEAHGVPGESLAPALARALAQAQRLYTGDLLSDWYSEWCAPARDRFRHMALGLLDKLVDYHRARGEYEAGISYASSALQHDRARERAHRNLMSLLYLSGDRSEALRQFDRCAVAMREELDVEPEAETIALRRLISNGAEVPSTNRADRTGGSSRRTPLRATESFTPRTREAPILGSKIR